MKLKKISGYVTAFIAGSLLSGTVAMAATTYVQAQKGSSVFQLNGQQVSSAPKLVYGGTTYVQLYSIQQALKQAGVTATWDGSKDPGVFNMVTQSPSQSTDVITFSNITVKSDSLGDTIVDGIAKNNDKVEHTFFLTVSFFDANGKLLGTASGAVDQLAAGDSKTFEAMASEDYTQAASYKVQIDTIV